MRARDEMPGSAGRDAAAASEASRRFFLWLTGRPRTVWILATILALGCSAFLPRLRLDTTIDAFISARHPAVVRRDAVKSIFGFSEPIVLAIVNEGPAGIFTPHSLGLVQWFTDALRHLRGIRLERVISLATEKNIAASGDGMDVTPFLETVPKTQEEAEAVRRAVHGFPFYRGTLVSDDDTATLVVAEIGGDLNNSRAYQEILALARRAPLTGGEKVYVAGDAAVSEYFGKYVFLDSMRLTPAAFFIVSLILFVAYRSLRGVLLPNLVVLSAVGTTLGVMAALDIPYYGITNALPVLLVAIGVADGIHILGEYYEQEASDPGLDRRERVVRTMTRMWWPVTVTSLTDIGGFMALGLSSYMPPMHAFGLFASLGVAVAWLFSLLVIPSVLMLLPRKASPAFRPRRTGGPSGAPDGFGRLMAGVGMRVTRRPTAVLALSLLVLAAGVFGAARLRIDENRIENFQKKEPIYRADRIISRKFNGTMFLDVVVETPDPDGLDRPENLRRIEDFERFARDLPHVRGTTSFLGLLRQMHRAMNGGGREAAGLPESEDLVAQYFLLYAAGGAEEDLERFIDFEHRRALVRLSLDTGWISDFDAVMQQVQTYLDEVFRAPGLTARTTGRVDVDYHWMQGLVRSHFRGVALALVAVWLMVSLFLRSPAAGGVALIPVTFAVLLIYGFMGISGIALDVSTSMFAAILLGCGVDFAVHTLDSLIARIRGEGQGLEEALGGLFPSTGRALLFNFAAIFSGFLVLTASQVPAIVRFGLLTCVAVTVSFAATILVLPALLRIFRPRFLFGGGTEEEPALRGLRTQDGGSGPGSRIAS